MHERYYVELAKQEKLLSRKNEKSDFYNGVFDRYVNPVLTRDMIPLTWRYDLNEETNPFFMERLGINAVMNSGAIYLNGKYYLVARIEGNDRKSFFGVAESDNGIDNFRFWDYPILLDDVCPEETNVYDMRLTQHEDGYIYGVFCSESKDTSVNDLSAAVAAAGIVRTKDLKHWERLENLKTLRSPQQRNVVLHPEFVDGKYAFYTRPMDDFIDTGSGSGIGFGLCEDITHAVIDEEKMTSIRKYHTITEAKNGAGATPIKTDKGWIHIAHGVRNTAAGLRYVIYAFATDLNDEHRKLIGGVETLRIKQGFYVYAKPNQCDPKNVVKYIGRYLGRPVIATSRIDHYDGESVTFHYNRHEDEKYVEETLPAIDFIKRLIRHIPEKHFKMIRYGGIYARHREIDKHLHRAVAKEKHHVFRCFNQWRTAILSSFGYDPLQCPDCRHEMEFLELYYNHQRVSLEELYEKAMSKSRGKRSSA